MIQDQRKMNTLIPSYYVHNTMRYTICEPNSLNNHSQAGSVTSDLSGGLTK